MCLSKYIVYHWDWAWCRLFRDDRRSRICEACDDDFDRSLLRGKVWRTLIAILIRYKALPRISSAAKRSNAMHHSHLLLFQWREAPFYPKETSRSQGCPFSFVASVFLSSLNVFCPLAGRICDDCTDPKLGRHAVYDVPETRHLFLVLFPVTTIDGNSVHLSPPSYNCIFPGVPCLYTKCCYSLTIVTKRKISIWWTKNWWGSVVSRASCARKILFVPAYVCCYLSIGHSQTHGHRLFAVLHVHSAATNRLPCSIP
jgi:hypothetical protein